MKLLQLTVLTLAGWALVAAASGARATPVAPLPAAAAATIAPAPAETLTLSQAIRDGQQQRPLLDQDRQRVGLARARITEAKSRLRPQVDLEVSAADGPLVPPPSGLRGPTGSLFGHHATAAVNLVQTLLDFGRTHHLVRSRRSDLLATQEALQADRNQVFLDVTRGYLAALQAQRLLDVNRRILEQRLLVVRQAETLAGNGLASRVDVDLAQLSVSQAQLAVVRAQNDVENGFAQLGQAIGRPVPVTTRLQDVAPPSPVPSGPGSTPPAVRGGGAPGTGAAAPLPRLLPRSGRSAAPSEPGAPGAFAAQGSDAAGRRTANAGTQPAGESGAPGPLPPGLGDTAPDLQQSIADALRNRPELRAAAAQVRSAESLVSAAKAEKRPLVAALASAGKLNPTPLDQPRDQPYAVAVGVTVPLFTGGLLDSQVEQARRSAGALRAQQAELVNSIRQQVTSAVAGLRASEMSVQVAQQQLVQADDALRLATTRYAAQLGTIVELAQAQVGYATAQNDYIRALHDRELARAALGFAVGSTDGVLEPGSR